jgi:hypothetical protein
MSERFSAMRGMAAMAPNMRSMPMRVPCVSQTETNTFFQDPKKTPSAAGCTIGSCARSCCGRHEPGRSEPGRSDDSRDTCGNMDERETPPGGWRLDSRGAGGDEGEEGSVAGALLRRSGGGVLERRGGRSEETMEALD